MPRATRPVESFGPEVFQGLIEGSKRRIVLDLPYRKAVYFRLRANQLRAEMRRQNHPMYSIVSQTKLSIEWDEDTPVKRSSTGVKFPTSRDAPVRLIIAPNDAEFSEALRKAGVEIKPIPSSATPEQPPKPPDTPTVVDIDDDDVLSQYVKDNPS